MQTHQMMSHPGDFPGGPEVKNLPSNTGDTGSIPGQETKIPHVGRLTYTTTATGPESDSGSRPDRPDPGIEPWSPTLQADSLPSEPPGKPYWTGAIAPGVSKSLIGLSDWARVHAHTNTHTLDTWLLRCQALANTVSSKALFVHPKSFL